MILPSGVMSWFLGAVLPCRSLKLICNGCGVLKVNPDSVVTRVTANSLVVIRRMYSDRPSHDQDGFMVRSAVLASYGVSYAPGVPAGEDKVNGVIIGVAAGYTWRR